LFKSVPCSEQVRQLGKSWLSMRSWQWRRRWWYYHHHQRRRLLRRRLCAGLVHLRSDNEYVYRPIMFLG